MPLQSVLALVLLLCLSATPVWGTEQSATPAAELPVTVTVESTETPAPAAEATTEQAPEPAPAAEQAAPATPVVDEATRRAAAADRYLEHVDLDESMQRIYAALSEHLPGQQGALLIALMQELVRMENLAAHVKQTLMQHYTADELEALAAFYSSELGQSISRKLPEYLNDVNLAIQGEAQRALALAVEEIQKQMAEIEQDAAAQPETGNAADAAPEAPGSSVWQQWEVKGGQ